MMHMCIYMYMYVHIISLSQIINYIELIVFHKQEIPTNIP